jgi:DNA-binding MarR family transcriptional regulator
VNHFSQRSVRDSSQLNFDGLVELNSLQRQLDSLRFRLESSTATEPPSKLVPDNAERLALKIVASRRRRDAFFGQGLFGEPAWDLLLELYVAEQAQRRVCITRVCEATAVAFTTALRWIERLEKDGLVTRKVDVLDRRRIWVMLTDRGSNAMREYLEGIADLATSRG